jgi:uncharacterized membrane protein
MGFAITTVTSFTSWWSAYYSDHQMVSLTLRYVHLASLMVGGGTALAIDRVVLGSARRRTEDRRHAAMTALSGSHRVVVPALVVVAITGVLMTAADWATFEASRIFWIKMALFAMLLANGGLLVAAERRYANGVALEKWRGVILASGASVLLWMLILWVGEWLTVAA